MEGAQQLKPQQLAFFAQDELITISPNRHMATLHFLNVRLDFVFELAKNIQSRLNYAELCTRSQ